MKLQGRRGNGKGQGEERDGRKTVEGRGVREGDLKETLGDLYPDVRLYSEV